LQLVYGHSARGHVTCDEHAQHVGEVAHVLGFEPIPKRGL
jgi:hypothetical protein